MLLGIELLQLAIHLLKEKNIMLRGLAHPMMFSKTVGSKLPDMQMFDSVRIGGAVPVSSLNFYKLLRSKAHVLLYPGGVREALHRKVMLCIFIIWRPSCQICGYSHFLQGEEYKLFWPQHSEFVRIASKFGAKIIPFGVVGEDDLCQVSIVSFPYWITMINILKTSFRVPSLFCVHPFQSALLSNFFERFSDGFGLQ